MAHVFKKSKNAKVWSVRFYDYAGPGATPVQRSRKGFANKTETEALGDKLEADARRRRLGLVNQEEEQAKRTMTLLTKAAHDFYLTLNGASRDHQDRTYGFVLEVAKDRNWQTLADMNAQGLQGWMGSVASRLSARSINARITALKQFVNWCLEGSLLVRSPFLGVKKLNVDKAREYVRRALTADEVKQLLEAAAGGVEWQGLTGKDREAIYRMALCTGLRADELRRMRVCDFDLDKKTFTVFGKNQKDETLPLRSDLVELLRERTAGKKPTDPAVKMSVGRRDAEMLRTDFAAAGIAAANARGEVADFHSLRHTFITFLVQAGVNVKACQKLARHADITTTLKYYVHQDMESQRAELEKAAG